MKNPPITVPWLGISLTPKIGIQTQKIPPITSVSDNSVSSAAGIFLIQLNIKLNQDTLMFRGLQIKPHFFPKIKMLSH